MSPEVLPPASYGLDLGPLLELRRCLSRAAFYTGLTLYLQVIVTAVLIDEGRLESALAWPIGGLWLLQLGCAFRPARRMLRGQLVGAYRWFWALAAAFLSFVILSAGGCEGRVVAGLLAVLSLAPGLSPSLTLSRRVQALAPQVSGVQDARLLSELLMFDPSATLSASLRSFAGQRRRWAAPWLGALLAALSAAALFAALVSQLAPDREVGLPGGLLGAAALWVYYRALRFAKPRAAQLRAEDPRPAVVLLRQFDDDLFSRRPWNPGASFEHAFVSELEWLGPTIAIGKPSEGLPPLGASRDYLQGADWMVVVSQLMADAAAVVFVLGTSEHLLWEFRTAVTMRGKARLLVLLPPVREREALARRWQAFLAATTAQIGGAVPPRLPSQHVLGFLFVGADGVLLTRPPGPQPTTMLSRKALDYRLAVRLALRVMSADVGSGKELQVFLRARLPWLSLATTPAAPSPSSVGS